MMPPGTRGNAAAAVTGDSGAAARAHIGREFMAVRAGPQAQHTPKDCGRGLAAHQHVDRVKHDASVVL